MIQKLDLEYNEGNPVINQIVEKLNELIEVFNEHKHEIEDDSEVTETP